MKTLELSSPYIKFAGSAYTEPTPQGVILNRLSSTYKDLQHEDLLKSSQTPSGVRLCTISNTTTISITLELIDSNMENQSVDLCVNHQYVCTQRFAEENRKTFVFEGLGSEEKIIEIWLPTFSRIRVCACEVDDNSSLRRYEDTRPRWITYGSSITMCRRAECPTQSWPVIVADAFNWNLRCLGFGGQCHFDPIVARDIASFPAAFISLCLGINTHGGSFSMRTWTAAVEGFILTIRDGHPFTPLLIMSPIYSFDRETTPGKTEITLPMMREWLQETVEKFKKRGDSKIAYLNGLDIISEKEADCMPDNLHPDAEGIKLMGSRITGGIRNCGLLPQSMLPYKA